MNINNFKNKSILTTSVTESFGINFIKFLLKKNPFSRIIIFSRDEGV